MPLTDAEWNDLRSENMYDTEPGVRRFVDALLDDRVRAAAAEGWDAAVRSLVYEDGTPVDVAGSTNPYRKAGA